MAKRTRPTNSQKFKDKLIKDKEIIDYINNLEEDDGDENICPHPINKIEEGVCLDCRKDFNS